VPGVLIEIRRVIGIDDEGAIIEAVHSALRELRGENWGVRAGQAACDVDLGFRVDV
jgi:hypothetical protein